MKGSNIKKSIFFLFFALFGFILCPIKGFKITEAQETYSDTNYSNHWVLCLDRSQNMGDPLIYNLNRMDLAEIGANLFIKLIHPGDIFNLVTYAEEAKQEFSIPELSAEDLYIQEIEIMDAIGLVLPDGLAFLGEGLNECLNILEEQEKKYNEYIILLSSQWSSYGIEPEILLPELVDRGTRIYPIGIGGKVDNTLLLGLATDTGGRYSYIPDEIFLPASFAYIWSEIIGGEEIAREFNIILSGETLFEQALVDPYCKEATFILYWMKKESNLECLLIDPDGTRITPLSGSIPSAIYPYSGINYFSRKLYKIFKIKQPTAGIWQMKIISQGGSGEIPYVFEVIAENKEGYSDILSINTDKQFYNPSESIQLQALLNVQELIGDVTITGKVNGPGRSTAEIALYDDGISEHNDQIALDGIFSGSFTPCSIFSENDYQCNISPGPYVFNMTALNDIALALNDQYMSDQIYGYPFHRRANITIIIGEDETNLPPVSDAGQDQEIILDLPVINTNVQLSGLNSYDPEGKTLYFAWYAPKVKFDDPTNPTPMGIFPIGKTMVTLVVSDGINISEPDEVMIDIKRKIKDQYYNPFYQFSPYFHQFSPYNNILYQKLPITNNNLSFHNINSLPFNFYLNSSTPSYFNYFPSSSYYSDPLSYLFLYSLGKFNNYIDSSKTLSMIIDSPYTTSFVFGSGYLYSNINIIINYYYTYNYY